MTHHTNMTGKLCVVTGANSGIGKETCKALAQMGAHVVMACRSQERGEAARREIIAASGSDKVDLMLVDLSSMDDIRRFASEYKAKYDRLDVLNNNAGAVFSKRRESIDGLEMTFALDHIGYFLPTMLLLDMIKASGTPESKARIVNVSSGAHTTGNLDFSDLQKEQKYSTFKAYGDAKLCNVLFTYELARRLEAENAPVTVNALHPGFVNTGFGGGNGPLLNAVMVLTRPFQISAEQGAQTSIYLCTSPEVEDATGGYFAKSQAKKSSPRSYDEETQRRLWQVSEELTGLREAASA